MTYQGHQCQGWLPGRPKGNSPICRLDNPTETILLGNDFGSKVGFLGVVMHLRAGIWPSLPHCLMARMTG